VWRSGEFMRREERGEKEEEEEGGGGGEGLFASAHSMIMTTSS